MWRSKVLSQKIVDEHKLFSPNTHAHTHSVSAPFLSAAFKWRLSQLAPFSHNYQTKRGRSLASNKMFLTVSSWLIIHHDERRGFEWAYKTAHPVSPTTLAQQGEKGRRGRSKCQKGEPGTPGLRGESVRVALLCESAPSERCRPRLLPQSFIVNTEKVFCIPFAVVGVAGFWRRERRERGTWNLGK